MNFRFIKYLYVLVFFLLFGTACRKIIADPKPTDATVTNWPNLGNLTAQPISCLYLDKADNLYAAGINNYYGSSANSYWNVGMWTGRTWNQLGAGANPFNYPIVTLCGDTSGNLYAAGDFTDGATYNAGKYYVAKWNGSAWSILGGGGALNCSGTISSVVFNPATNYLYAATSCSSTNANLCDVYVWNGTNWATLTNSANKLNNGVAKLYVDNAGNLYAGGCFTNTNGKHYVAKWNGNTWTELGSGTNALNANGSIKTICSDATGNIYAAGDFTNANGKNYVAKWNGTAWIELGGANALNANGTITVVTVDNAGNLYAAGGFYYTVGSLGDYTFCVAKWDGTKWGILGDNKLFARQSGTYYNLEIGFNDLKVNAAGTVFAVGNFTDLNGYCYVGRYP